MTSLIKLFNKQNVQYFAGITQRNYEWTKRELETYWDCLENNTNIKSETTHFMNCIITKPLSNNKLLDYISLTDGQQRMTTTILNICAICAFVKHSDIPATEFGYEDVRDELLINPKKTGDDKYKLLLREKDRDTLKLIIDELPMHLNNGTNRSSKIINAYNFLYGKLTIDNYQEVFDKLFLMTTLEIIAEPTDDENIIFESINTGGKQVSLFDQIRAFTLSSYDLKRQEEINKKYWEKIENNKSPLTIMRSFITYKTGSNRNNDYQVFKQIANKYESIESLLDEISDFYKIYCSFESNSFDDEELTVLVEGLKLFMPTIYWVSLIKIYKFYLNSEINRTTLLHSFELILNVILRNKLKINGQNPLIRQLFEANIKWISPNNLYNTLYKKLTPMFISDNQFEMIICSKNFYRGKKGFEEENGQIPANIGKITDYFLKCIENCHYPKGRINFKSYSIEHICPQTLANDWEHFFSPEDHHDYVHSLGNLTLTAYNSEYSNLSFKEKKMMENGFKDDKLYLNKCICEYTTWTVDSIRQRTELLAKELCEIFKIPANNLSVSNNGNQSILIGGK